MAVRTLGGIVSTLQNTEKAGWVGTNTIRLKTKKRSEKQDYKTTRIMLSTKHFIILCLILVSKSLAYCPNSCSGKGSCGDYDICTCVNGPDGNPAFTGPDCSQRTCPLGTAFVGDVVSANNMHPLVECSNKGECERSGGHCLCYIGFEGIACERTSCPKSCHANGICISQSELADEANRVYETPWDALKLYGCVCDIGYRGVDCSLLECPSSSDPRGGFGNESGMNITKHIFHPLNTITNILYSPCFPSQAEIVPDEVYAIINLVNVNVFLVMVEKHVTAL